MEEKINTSNETFNKLYEELIKGVDTLMESTKHLKLSVLCLKDLHNTMDSKKEIEAFLHSVKCTHLLRRTHSFIAGAILSYLSGLHGVNLILKSDK